MSAWRGLAALPSQTAPHPAHSKKATLATLMGGSRKASRGQAAAAAGAAASNAVAADPRLAMFNQAVRRVHALVERHADKFAVKPVGPLARYISIDKSHEGWCVPLWLCRVEVCLCSPLHPFSSQGGTCHGLTWALGDVLPCGLRGGQPDSICPPAEVHEGRQCTLHQHHHEPCIPHF